MKVGRVARARVTPLVEKLTADGLVVRLDEGTWIAALDAEKILGVAHLFTRDGIHAVDDLWVEKSERTHGVASALLAAAKARRRPLWMICDPPDVDFYVRRGFIAVEKEEFPAPLAEYYREKKEWPADADHDHVAMHWE